MTTPPQGPPSAEQMRSMWNARYGEDGFAYGTEPNAFVAEQIDQLRSGRALCIAEGEGRNAVFLAERSFEVQAVDLSAVGLEKAARLAAERGVSLETRVIDMADYPWEPESFDTVVSIFAHMPPPVRKGVHRGVVRALAPGGVLLLEAYTPDQVERGTGGPPMKTMMMTLDELREELEGLTFEIGREIVRDVVEGKYHHGEAAVVQVLARKPG